MNKRTADRLHRRGVKACRVVEFYKPGPKLATPVPEVAVPNIAAGDILRELLGNSETLQDVVVFMRDNDNVLGFVSTLDGAGETLLFVQRVMNRMITAPTESEDGKGPRPA